MKPYLSLSYGRIELMYFNSDTLDGTVSVQNEEDGYFVKLFGASADKQQGK